VVDRFQVDEEGFFGEFGGAFIPEMLYPNISELRDNYKQIIESSEFIEEYQKLLRDYVGRPSPLYHAKRLSARYGFEVYLKREDLNHTGSHKVNNVIGQALLAKRLRKKRIIAETGAGQHGVATATICALLDIPCTVFMGAVDVDRQAPNVNKMKMLGATVVPVTSGSKTLKDATNEALREWIAHPVDTYYLIGSVVGPHPFPDMVARFQSIISEEIRNQLKHAIGREEPDVVLACIGGGSNAMGAFYHYLTSNSVRLVGVEAGGKGVETSFSAATTALGTKGVLHGSMTMVMQTDDGQVVEPHSISAGLDYPGIGPQHAHLHMMRRVEYVNVTDEEAVEAAFRLTSHEGIIPALESAHACAYLEKLNASPNSVVVVNLSGDGEKDMRTYLRHFQSDAV